jgi:hypothetical protein
MATDPLLNLADMATAGEQISTVRAPANELVASWLAAAAKAANERCRRLDAHDRQSVPVVFVVLHALLLSCVQRDKAEVTDVVTGDLVEEDGLGDVERFHVGTGDGCLVVGLVVDAVESAVVAPAHDLPPTYRGRVRWLDVARAH